jgi:hypothetical protein
MIVVVTASADTYVTDKIVDSTRAVSGNVGRAGTIDIFKLYNESYQVTGAIEISRALLSFDYGRLRELVSSSLNVSDFRAVMKMKNVSTGQPVPSNFTLSLFPLARTFNEGLGRDVSSFADVDTANFLSRSVDVEWFASGCSAGGLLGSVNIDYISSGNLGDGLGVRSFETKQSFVVGNEDLEIDVTDFVSASLVGQIPTSAFRLSYTGSQENDSVTRFVKRFASRHVKDEVSRPKIVVYFDDSRIDNRKSMLFDVSGTLYLTNTVRGSRRNFVSGSSLSPVVGSNCLILTLTTGSFSASFTGSQDSYTSPVVGVYQAPVIITSNDSRAVSGSVKLSDHIRASGSITFGEKWTSLDSTVIFRSGTFTMRKEEAETSFYLEEKLVAHCSGPQTAPHNTPVLVRVRFFDLSHEQESSKFPLKVEPIQIESSLYRFVDAMSGQVIVDFDSVGTKMSLDENGNFFTFYSDIMPYGRPITLEFLATYNGNQKIVSGKGYTFTLGN